MREINVLRKGMPTDMQRRTICSLLPSLNTGKNAWVALHKIVVRTALKPLLCGSDSVKYQFFRCLPVYHTQCTGMAAFSFVFWGVIRYNGCLME